jgi:pyruvate dehydrogenase E2 component (dihydrolipoamide acetyltransferase)
MNQYEFPMPTLGADMDYGTIVNWMIKPGDKIEKGQLVAEVETPKSNIEIESFYAGEVEKILIPEGERVDVGTPIAVLLVKEVIKKSKQKSKSKLTKKESLIKPKKRKKTSDFDSQKDYKLSPRAKKLCKDHKISPQDLEKIGKSIIKGEDILNILEQSEKVPPTKIEKRQLIIAHLMEKSNHTIPHFFIEKEMSMEVALNWMYNQNEKRDMNNRYIPAVLFIKVLALALKKFPRFNGTYQNEIFKESNKINIGIIISLREGGLIAPAISNADTKTLDQLMNEFRDLVERSKNKKLKRIEMNSSTICLTNLGERGADRVFGIIYPPQVAIIGTGAILTKYIKKEDVAEQFKEIQVCNWTLSGDHRVTDGHQASLFLNKINSLLQKPERWDE